MCDLDRIMQSWGDHGGSAVASPLVVKSMAAEPGRDSVIRLSGWTKARTVFVFCFVVAVASPAQVTYTTLGSFNGTNGANPDASMVQGTDGNFYGTTLNGGANNGGAVFKITPAGALTTLYSFCQFDGCPDGAGPTSNLIQATDGDFYGTASGGGAGTNGSGGTIFKITAAGALATLYSFCSQPGCADGDAPLGGLVQGTDGNFYGTTGDGGASTLCDLGCGSVFKMTPDGTLTTLYSFCLQINCPDGEDPEAGLIQATDGNFYGTTAGGGALNCDNGCGTVFKMTPGGALTTLYSFCEVTGCPDGFGAFAPLIQATDGNFYGSTDGGEGGTIFKITPAGTLTTLSTTVGSDDGLIQASDGNFYGTSPFGGANQDGFVFKITATGTLTTLYSFCSQANCADGEAPEGGLVQATSGIFYGTAFEGGQETDECGAGCGTVFSLVVPLPVSTFTPVSVNFGNQASGVPSSPQPVTLKNTGGEPLLISSIVDANGFSQTNNCPTAPAALPAGQSCTISITFTPSGAGTENGTLIVTDNALGSPHRIPLTGVGQAPFSLTSNCTSLSVVPGQTAIYTVSLAPAPGFTKSVSLSCNGAPALATCTVNPSMITLDGSSSVQAQVTATTTPATSGSLQPNSQKNENRLAGLIGLAGTMGLAGLVILPGKRRGKAARLVGLILGVCLLSTVVTMSSCGGGSGAGT